MSDEGERKTKMLEKALKGDVSLTELFENNEDAFLDISLDQYIKKAIKDKGVTTSSMIRSTGINRRYFYDILSGKRNPSRDNMLRILLALEISLEKAQWLLRASCFGILYPRDKRDGVIMYSLIHGASVEECNQILEKNALKPI